MKKTSVGRAVAALCVLVAVLSISGAANADRVWVATQVFDPQGDVVRGSLNVVVPEFDAVVPESVPLPNNLITSVAQTADGELFVTLSIDPLADVPEPVVSVAGTHPPQLASQYELPEALWQNTGNLLLAIARLGVFPERVVVVPRSLVEDLDDGVSGELLLLPLRGDQIGPTYSGQAPDTIPLTQGAAAVAPLDRDAYNAVVVLEWSGSELWVVEANLDAGTTVNLPVSLSSNNIDQTPVSIQKLPGRNEYIVVDTAFDPVNFEPVTEVWLVSLVDAGPADVLNPDREPFVLNGRPDIPAGLHNAAEISADGSVALVATRDETTETGHIGLIDIGNVRLGSQLDVPDVRENFIVRLRPDGLKILIGADHTFEMRSVAAGASVVEDKLIMLQTVQDIAISNDTVNAYIASGPEVYLYDTGTKQLSLPALSMPTGVVAALGVLTSQPSDADEDGLRDIDEQILGSSPFKPDTDGDGLTDGEEVFVYGTDPLEFDGEADPLPDADNDGLRDGYETMWGTDPNDFDTDDDGASDRLEITWGTDPLNPTSHPLADSDSDGLSDMDEISRYFTDSIDPDTDGDGVSDGPDFSRLIQTPALSLSTHKVTLTAIEGRAAPPPRSVRITNRGTGELQWTAYVTDVDWLDVEPSTPILPDAVIISARTAGLSAAPDLPYTGHVLVAGSGGDVSDSPQIIEVNLFIDDAVQLETVFVAENTGEQEALSAMNGLTNEGYALFANILLSEDINDNGLLDPGEDINENGVLDPGYSYAFDEYTTSIPVDASAVGVVQPVIVTGLPWQGGQPNGEGLLDYIDAGGTALVILKRAINETDASAINLWLAQTGIHVLPNVEYAGIVEPLTGHPITVGVSEIDFKDSAALEVADDTAVVLGWLDMEKGHAAIAAAFYGKGLIVVLADEYAFTNAGIGNYDHRQFAENIFSWLSPGGASDLDTDNDGIFDRIEDANGNGVVDAGETDPLNSDSDGDLVPDGREDLDGDGILDFGETDPADSDTDDDGFTDGTDRFPLTWPKPFIGGTVPAIGSTSGGQPITIVGRYLPADATVLFGDIPSSSVTFVDSEHIIAYSPEWDGSCDCLVDEDCLGLVDVKVIDNETGASATLPCAFTYDPQERVVLDIGNGVTKKDDDGTYDNAFVPVTITNLDFAQPGTVEMTIAFDMRLLTFVGAMLRPDLTEDGKTVWTEVDDEAQTLSLEVFSEDPSPPPPLSPDTVISSDSTYLNDPKFLTLEFEVESSVDRGTILPLTFTHALAIDVDGSLPIETLWNNGAVATMIDADVNDDGLVTSVDLQLVINGVLGLDVGLADVDVDKNGLIDAVDVQKMINALLGIYAI